MSELKSVLVTELYLAETNQFLEESATAFANFTLLMRVRLRHAIVDMDSASRVLAQSMPSGVPRSYRVLANHSGVPRSTLYYWD